MVQSKQETYDKIMIAAADVFVESGFGGARMDEIAKRAGVNKASIYYNIGNKETLYTVILTKTFKDAFSEINEILEPAQSSMEKLEIYIRMFAKALFQNPHIPRMLMWEHASGGRSFPESVFSKIVHMLGILDSILKEGEDKNDFDKTDTLTIQFMIMGALMFHNTSAAIREKHLGQLNEFKQWPNKKSDNLVDSVVKYLLKAVRKGG